MAGGTERRGFLSDAGPTAPSGSIPVSGKKSGRSYGLINAVIVAYPSKIAGSLFPEDQLKIPRV